jgi:Txe/YoeB family toxin of Txe-Axe toxin-antitoxin module
LTALKKQEKSKAVKDEASIMLGVYENFPETVHKTADFTISTTSKKLQQTIIQLIKEANNKTFNLEDITVPTIPKCATIFEFGIAEANSFNYLDNEEANRILEAIQKKPFQIIDFYCALKYYKTQNDKKTSLRFDYYMVRFAFPKDLMSMQIFHEKGPRYISPEDIVNFFVGKINAIFSKKALKTRAP